MGEESEKLRFRPQSKENTSMMSQFRNTTSTIAYRERQECAKARRLKLASDIDQDIAATENQINEKYKQSILLHRERLDEKRLASRE